MSLTAKPFVQGKYTVIAGPVDSGKTEYVEQSLDALVDSGFKRDGNVLVFRHPLDDSKPERIGKHKVIVTEQVEPIYDKIQNNTRTVMVLGASHFTDSNLIELSDAIIRSNRNFIASGLNLDVNGLPHGYMDRFMALADEVILTKSICSEATCQDLEANRSIKNGETYLPICTHHYTYPGSPSLSAGQRGFLELTLGPMYSAKSTRTKHKIDKYTKAEIKFLAFKWLNDDRYGEKQGKVFDRGYITLHNDKKIPAVMVRTASDIKEYLHRTKNQQIRHFFADEVQFMPRFYELCLELLPQGYHIGATGLIRGFNRQPFGEVPKLMCLADKIDINYANCVVCFHPATENQRMKRIDDGKPQEAHYDDPLVLVGGKDDKKVKDFYQARCLRDWVLVGEPQNQYRMTRFSV